VAVLAHRVQAVGELLLQLRPDRVLRPRRRRLGRQRLERPAATIVSVFTSGRFASRISPKMS